MAAYIYVDDCGPTCSGSGTPSDPYCCISTAVAAAADGDIVALFPGTYTGTGNKNISWTGKNLTIAGKGGARLTIIDLEGSGRAFALSDPAITLATRFEGLRIVNGYVVGERGGAILLAGAPLSGFGPSATIKDCVFRNCEAEAGGALATLYGTLEMDGTLVLDNHATDRGGGIHLVDTEATIRTSRITGNTTPGSGGGLLFQAVLPFFVLKSFEMQDCIIQSNTAGAFGGGIAISTGILVSFPSFTSIDRCKVLANTVSGNNAVGGGGIALCAFEHLAPGAATLSVTNSVVAKNTAVATQNGKAQGGGLYVDILPDLFHLYSTIICNSTFAENVVIGSNVSADDKGGGIFKQGPMPLTVRDVILWENTAPDGGNEIAFNTGDFGNALFISFSDVHGTGGICPLSDTPAEVLLEGHAFETCGPGNQDVDPSFVNPALGDFHIQATSLVKDQGDATGCGVFDIDLEPRVDQGFVDMGADEIQQP